MVSSTLTLKKETAFVNEISQKNCYLCRKEKARCGMVTDHKHEEFAMEKNVFFGNVEFDDFCDCNSCCCCFEKDERDEQGLGNIIKENVYYIFVCSVCKPNLQKNVTYRFCLLCTETEQETE